MRPTRGWIWIDGVKYEKGTEPRQGGNANMVIEDIKPYVSPIDGSIISSRPHQREHMRKHGVTHSSDYSPEFLASRRKEREAKQLGLTKADTADRIRHIKHKMGML